MTASTLSGVKRARDAHTLRVPAEDGVVALAATVTAAFTFAVRLDAAGQEDGQVADWSRPGHRLCRKRCAGLGRCGHRRADGSRQHQGYHHNDEERFCRHVWPPFSSLGGTFALPAYRRRHQPETFHAQHVILQEVSTVNHPELCGDV